MTTNTHLVPFKGETVTMLERDGEPFVPIAPICDRLGLATNKQRAKLASEPRWRGDRMVLPSAGGEQETWALPLRMLPAWLFSISPAKVRPDVREALVAYQDECSDVLWRYWSGGKAHRLRVLERSQAKLTGLFKAYVPWAGKLAALQEAGVFRSDAHLHLRSWSKSLVIQMIDELEQAGLIDIYGWAEVKIQERMAAYERANPDPDGPTAMERLMGADDHG